MYEDDGLTREYRRDKFARTLITSNYNANGKYTVNIGAATGDYTGKPANRTFIVSIHTGIIQEGVKPAAVTINGVEVAEKSDSSSLVNSTEGWWWNNIKKGVVYAKTNTVSSGTPVTVIAYIGTDIAVSDVNGKDVLKNFSAVYNSGKILLSFANNFSGKMTARLYTLQGKLIMNKEIDVKNSKAVLWNSGAKTVNGNYLLRLEYNSKTAYKKVAVLN
jgi:hypothetical protein